MTWIVGRAVVFGYAAGISDVRITLSDGTERDCLQKIYPVGRFMAMGFAGSVQIGFMMVDALRGFLQNAAPDEAWRPEEVAKWWPRDAREIFSTARESEQTRKCELMILSAHPSEKMGAAPWPRCYVHCFGSCENFVPQLAEGDQVISIGKGSGVDEYAAALIEAARSFPLLQYESAHPGGAAYGLMTAVRAAVEEKPVRGVSPRLQICTVRLGRIDVEHWNRHTMGDPGPDDLVMPALARGWDELNQLLSAAGREAAGATC